MIKVPPEELVSYQDEHGGTLQAARHAITKQRAREMVSAAPLNNEVKEVVLWLIEQH